MRIRTEDGCAYCKFGEAIFLWAEKVEAVWDAERSIDWPKWRMYPEKGREEKKEKEKEDEKQ